MLLQIRWLLDQIYVNDVKHRIDHYTYNGNGGCTISIKKRGGWAVGWKDAQLMAGWTSVDTNAADGPGAPDAGDDGDDDAGEK